MHTYIFTYLKIMETWDTPQASVLRCSTRTWENQSPTKLNAWTIYQRKTNYATESETQICILLKVRMRGGCKLTWSTKPSSWATNNLSRSRVLLTDEWWPTANNIRSPDPTEHWLSNCSLLVRSKLETNAGIPSIFPEIQFKHHQV